MGISGVRNPYIHPRAHRQQRESHMAVIRREILYMHTSIKFGCQRYCFYVLWVSF